MDQNTIRTQLAPGWTPVNIIILAVLFVFVWWPLGVLMLAYILFGPKLGLHLAEPATFKAAFARLTSGKSTSSGSATRWNGDSTDTGSPDAVSSGANGLRDEAEHVRQDRETLDRERAEFNAEKQAFEQKRREDA
ncbi:DUF2852 domain-containing protein [Granulosicoccus sp.]|nr:DUF2852 domain-containing protein [Granulosicoccus sp.]